MNKTAIILGATGLTGRILLDYLLEDTDYAKVKLFSRKPVGLEHSKLEEHLVDVLSLEKQIANFTASVVFCCVGTTKAKTPDEVLYKKIDYGIPVTAAKLAKQNGIETFVVISAMGVDPNSRVFYNKTKGEMERDVLLQGVSNTYIFQPSLIGGKRNEKRTGEAIGQFFMGAFGFLVPKKYKMIQPETIAKAMQLVAKNGYKEVRISSDKIKEIAGK